MNQITGPSSSPLARVQITALLDSYLRNELGWVSTTRACVLQVLHLQVPPPTHSLHSDRVHITDPSRSLADYLRYFDQTTTRSMHEKLAAERLAREGMDERKTTDR